MPLPAPNNQPWPPVSVAPIYAEYRRFSALYSGDVAEMMALESGYGSFWGRQGRLATSQQARLHVPLPADLSATSATLQFSEAPAVTIPEAHEERPNTEAVKTEVVLQTIIDDGDVFPRLIEAAETASAFGGVFLKVDWDIPFATFPILSVVQPDNALPEWRYGYLTAVTLWKVLPNETPNSTTVWRHVERHEVGPDGRGVILHGLYQGTVDRLGTGRDLGAHEETAELEPFVQLPFAGLAIRYVPNLLPNRRFRGLPIGRSDYAGAEHLFDALDEVVNDWMREFRLAKARLTVPAEFLKLRDGQPQFDVDTEIYSTLSVPPSAGLGITATQFQIRGEEFERAIMHLIQSVRTHAGRSPQRFGVNAPDAARTATEIRSQARDDLMTQQLKSRYWEPTLSDLFENMLILYASDIFREVREEQITIFRPEVKLADSLTPDKSELAGTAVALRQAGMSNQFIAEVMMPDGTPEEIREEVARMESDQGLTMPAELEGVPLA